MVKATLAFKQIVNKNSGQKMVKLISIENMQNGAGLPDKYTKTGLNIEYDPDEDAIVVFNGTEQTKVVTVGDEMTPEQMVELQLTVEAAGERLDDILAELRDSIANWDGRIVEYVVNEKKGIVAKLLEFLGL